ncbi:MAG: hypothetical protein ACK5LP_08815 [Campylobacteraceae bacterium]
MKTKKDLFNYIQKSTNWQIVPKKISTNVPLYIKAGYELWGAAIENMNIVFASVKDESVDIRIHQNAITRLSDITSCYAILVFEKLNARSADSLMKKHISFVVKDKQIYMPFALLQIQTHNLRKIPTREALSPDADTILIGYLNNKINNNMMIKEIAQVTCREIRASSQALRHLEALRYVQIEVRAQSKYVYFISELKAYERLKIEGKSPVKYTFFTKYFIKEAIYSGYTALSNYSTLIDKSIKTVAISHKMIKLLELNTLQCEEDEAMYKIEVWDRDPSIFAINSTINPLYVLRFFQNDEDESVQEALNKIEREMIKEFKEKDKAD